MDTRSASEQNWTGFKVVIFECVCFLNSFRPLASFKSLMQDEKLTVRIKISHYEAAVTNQVKISAGERPWLATITLEERAKGK